MWPGGGSQHQCSRRRSAGSSNPQPAVRGQSAFVGGHRPCRRGGLFATALLPGEPCPAGRVRSAAARRRQPWVATPPVGIPAAPPHAARQPRRSPGGSHRAPRSPHPASSTPSPARCRSAPPPARLGNPRRPGTATPPPGSSATAARTRPIRCAARPSGGAGHDTTGWPPTTETPTTGTTMTGSTRTTNTIRMIGTTRTTGTKQTKGTTRTTRTGTTTMTGTATMTNSATMTGTATSGGRTPPLTAPCPGSGVPTSPAQLGW